MSRLPDITHRIQERVRESMAQNENQVFMGLTFVIGAVVGLVIVAFIVVTDSLEEWLTAEGIGRWRRLVTPIAATLFAGYLLFRFFPDARGSGVPQTKAAMFARRGLIPLRTVIGKFVASSVTLASGIALGREGPSVQMGAGLASSIGRGLGLSGDKLQMLVPIGAAAALAAAFNTPLAAILFALEEIMGNLHAPILGSVVVSVFTSLFVMRLLRGNEPLFQVPAYEAVHPAEFIVYALLGIVGGLLSVCFVKLMLWMREKFLNMPRRTRWLQPAAGGVVVGVLAFALPVGFFRFGHHTVGEALNGSLELPQMVILLALSVFATAVCYASGNAGGIFGPSLRAPLLGGR